MHWNFKGAFIGRVLELAAAPDEGEVDERSLVFMDFLAAPLLEINNETGEERKFSGNEDIAHNKDPLGRMIDAYVHHTLIDSFGDILLVDVQGA
jgi:myosin-heavy-chain kinase